MASRITVAGDIGSGKTTVARRLAELAGVEPLSTGGIQRRLAQARGITVLELNRLAEEDGRIDQEIDSYLMNLPGGDLVVESRMAWHFVPDTLKVYLYISHHEAARRIVGAQRADEDYSKIADPMAEIAARRRSELLRFRKYYDVDIDALGNYDLVVDTTFAGVDAIVERIVAPRAGSTKPFCWIDPKNLVPTAGMETVEGERLASEGVEGARFGSTSGEEVATIYVDHVFYIVGGHARVAAALRQGDAFVPATITASNDQPFRDGLSARRFVEGVVRESLIREWEGAVGFRFPHEIWKRRSGAAHEAALGESG